MARDPAIAHDEDELRDGLWQVAAGHDLRLNDPLREELIHLGLARRAAIGDGLFLTPEGRALLG